MKFVPYWNYVLLQDMKVPEDYNGKVILPRIGQTGEMVLAKVIAAGPGRLDMNSNIVPIRVKPGDRVFYGKIAGIQLRIGTSYFTIVGEDSIYGAIDDGEYTAEELLNEDVSGPNPVLPEERRPTPNEIALGKIIMDKSEGGDRNPS